MCKWPKLKAVPFEIWGVSSFLPSSKYRHAVDAVPYCLGTADQCPLGMK